MTIKCCVPNCRRTEKKKHAFPLDTELFKKWCDAIGRKDLLTISLKQRYHYRICDEHFADNAKFFANRNRTNLKKNAVPTLFLPSSKLEVGVEQQQQSSSTSGKRLGSSIDFESAKMPKLASSSSLHLEVESTLEPPQVQNKIAMDATDETEVKISKTQQKGHLVQKDSVLKQIGVRKISQLSPKARKLYSITCSLKRTAKRLSTINASNKQRIKMALNSIQSGKFSSVKLNNTALNFMQSVIRNQSRSLHGRRYNLDDKIYALSLMKHGPRLYEFLRKVFNLPSRRTLTRLLNKVPFDIGFNKYLMDSLASTVKNMKPLDKVCSIIWDEMSIEPSLTYNQKQDYIIGFADTANSDSIKIADHVTVFMITGLHRKWKQPLAFYFTESGMSASEIVKNLKSISALQNMGFKVVATICDQLSANVSAIKMLREETIKLCAKEEQENRYFGFIVNKEEIVPLYDPPHLLKGFRNNLVKGDVEFKWKKSVQKGSWKDLIALYELDVGDHDFKLLHKLSDTHIYEHKMKKMKVKLAAQVFSRSVYGVMAALAKFGNACLPASAKDTADFILFVDQLFDSVNGSSVTAADGKPLKAAVTKISGHEQFWREAVIVLKTIKFLNKENEVRTPPTVKNWITTIEGFSYLWQELVKMGFTVLHPRNLNQDPLENFFGCIRAYGIRNVNPNCDAFINSYKSLIVNNFASTHSPGANCEVDDSEGAITNLRYFLSEGDEKHKDEDIIIASFNVDHEFTFSDVNTINKNIHSYVAGYIARQILKQTNNCAMCKSNLCSISECGPYDIIKAREFTTNQLLRPNNNFIRMFGKCNDLLHFYLPKLCTERNLKKKIMLIIRKFIVNKFMCSQHNLYTIFIKKFVNLYIYTWTTNINKILKGRKTKQINDCVKVYALNKFYKLKARKRKIQLMKQL